MWRDIFSTYLVPAILETAHYFHPSVRCFVRLYICICRSRSPAFSVYSTLCFLSDCLYKQMLPVALAAHALGEIGPGAWASDAVRLEATHLFRLLLSRTFARLSAFVTLYVFAVKAYDNFVRPCASVSVSAVEVNPPVDRVVRYGLVPVFVNYMKREDFPMLRVRRLRSSMLLLSKVLNSLRPFGLLPTWPRVTVVTLRSVCEAERCRCCLTCWTARHLM